MGYAEPRPVQTPCLHAARPVPSTLHGPQRRRMAAPGRSARGDGGSDAGVAYCQLASSSSSATTRAWSGMSNCVAAGRGGGQGVIVSGTVSKLRHGRGWRQESTRCRVMVARGSRVARPASVCAGIFVTLCVSVCSHTFARTALSRCRSSSTPRSLANFTSSMHCRRPRAAHWCRQQRQYSMLENTQVWVVLRDVAGAWVVGGLTPIGR